MMRMLVIFLAATLGATIIAQAYSPVEAAEKKVRKNSAAAKKAGWDVQRL